MKNNSLLWLILGGVAAFFLLGRKTSAAGNVKIPDPTTPVGWLNRGVSDSQRIIGAGGNSDQLAALGIQTGAGLLGSLLKNLFQPSTAAYSPSLQDEYLLGISSTPYDSEYGFLWNSDYSGLGTAGPDNYVTDWNAYPFQDYDNSFGSYFGEI